MNRNTVKILCCSVLVTLFYSLHATAASLEVIPNVVHIGTFYNGTTVTLSGLIPETGEAILRVTGDKEDLHFKTKGKIAGLLWMNTGDVTLQNAAGVDMIYTPKSILNIEDSGAKSFGLEALKDQISVIPVSEDKHFIVGEFIKLKEKDGLYTVNPGTVTYGPASKGMKLFTVVAAIPPRMKPDPYHIDLVVLQGDKITDELSASLTIEMVSFPAQISRLAFDHSLLHGVLAVLVALAAGLFIGVVFKNRGGAH
ncbi:MAG: TIGR02186 family protein [Deltaproteobacteria bacterium]|nr:TIGR02186 family protein [Deltaproteobacteria bacterium]MBW2659515.1 TIGR02186 family protein [Deltaproteobacteria bacterium]